ncbi:hypothetical protein J6590_102990, partial [Homalodisca vitripennis]
DSYDQSSGHGSKLSLHDKKSEPTGVEVTSEPLSHTAARHKMSVKPKRTHGVPRKRRSTQVLYLGSSDYWFCSNLSFSEVQRK